MRIAKFNEKITDNIITVEDELMVRDVFQDLDDSWDLVNIRPSINLNTNHHIDNSDNISLFRY